MFVCGLSISGQSVCVCVCDYAAKPFFATPYFLGVAPSKSPVKRHSDTNHSINVDQGFVGTFQSSVEVSRSVTASAVYLRNRLASPTEILDKRKPSGRCVNSKCSESVCLFVCLSVGNAFFIPLLENFCLKSYDLSYVL